MPSDKSEIDDESFFLSRNGRTDAQAELVSTIKGLFNTELLGDKATACRFPARTYWLKNELGIKDFPKTNCKAFNKINNKVNPKSVTLVFPSAYIKSPASMFGHTFLRINSSYDSKMLSYAVNYAADADEKIIEADGPLYAIKGLFGFYQGKYSLSPYYEKIKEYRDSEERDMWEYDLNLNEDEVKQMFRHIWEIHDTYSQYYFFTENCSYNMLWLLESGRSGLNLREHFIYQVSPPETIHVMNIEGLITNTKYRPARRSKLIAYEKELKDDDIQDVFSLAEEDISAVEFLNSSKKGTQLKQYILEASAEFIEYDFLANDINMSTYRNRLHAILSARASLGRGEELVIPKVDDVLEGSRAVRVRSELGLRNSEGIGFLGMRPVNHDIKDSDVGFLKGTQIEFFDFLFSYGKDENDDIKFNVEKATLINLESYAPRVKFFQPFSWRLNTGWDRNYLSESTKFTSNASGGFTWGNDLGYAYILADALFYTDRDLTVGLGGIAGLVAYQGKDFKTNLEITQRIFDTGHDQLLFSASQHYRSSQNISFSLSYDYVQKYHEDWDTLKFTFDYFF